MSDTPPDTPAPPPPTQHSAQQDKPVLGAKNPPATTPPPPPPPQKHISCKAIMTVTHGRWSKPSNHGGIFKQGTTSVLTCDDGYTVSGATSMECGDQGLWTYMGQLPTCSASKVHECASAPCKHGGHCTEQANAYACDCTSGWKGTNCDNTVVYCAGHWSQWSGCDEGGQQERSYAATQQQTDKEINCEAKDKDVERQSCCSPPPVVQNGHWVTKQPANGRRLAENVPGVSTFAVGSHVHLACESGFMPQWGLSVCAKHGQWNGHGKCSPSSRPSPPLPSPPTPSPQPPPPTPPPPPRKHSKSCSPGTYAATNWIAETCRSCPAGRFSEKVGSRSFLDCYSCPEGSTSESGATRCVVDKSAAPPPPAVQVAKPTVISPNGHQYPGRVGRQQPQWFAFKAKKDTTYVLNINLQDSSTSLRDSTMALIDRDKLTILVENDDDPRVHWGAARSKNSYIEWSCEHSGTYYIKIAGVGSALGDFTMKITAMRDHSGGVNGDPCKGGNEMTEPEATIKYAPDPTFQGDLQCVWVINCPKKSDKVTMFITALSTESEFDYLRLFDDELSSDKAPRDKQMAKLRCVAERILDCIVEISTVASSTIVHNYI